MIEKVLFARFIVLCVGAVQMSWKDFLNLAFSCDAYGHEGTISTSCIWQFTESHGQGGNSKVSGNGCKSRSGIGEDFVQ
jgi:hypothetical protein